MRFREGLPTISAGPQQTLSFYISVDPIAVCTRDARSRVSRSRVRAQWKKCRAKKLLDPSRRLHVISRGTDEAWPPSRAAKRASGLLTSSFRTLGARSAKGLTKLYNTGRF